MLKRVMSGTVEPLYVSQQVQELQLPNALRNATHNYSCLPYHGVRFNTILLMVLLTNKK